MLGTGGELIHMARRSGGAQVHVFRPNPAALFGRFVMFIPSAANRDFFDYRPRRRATEELEPRRHLQPATRVKELKAPADGILATRFPQKGEKRKRGHELSPITSARSQSARAWQAHDLPRQ
jgi:hypothetical protein